MKALLQITSMWRESGPEEGRRKEKRAMRKDNRFAWLIVVLVIAGLSGCTNVDSNYDFNNDGAFTSNVIFGSGVVAQENRTVNGFTRVVLAGEGTLHIEQGAVEELMVRAEDNFLPYIITEVRGGILEIRTRSNVDLKPTRPIEYHLTVVSLESIMLSGVGDIKVWDLMSPQLALTLSGVGNVEVNNLEADELDVALSGVGDFRVSGTVDVQRLNITGLGEYEARDLSSLDAEIIIAGNDNQTATVRVSDMLTVTINGNGTVFYIGDPFVDSDITGDGSVQQIPG